MRRAVGEIEKEWFLALRPHELYRLLGEPFVERLLVGLRLDDRLVAVEHKGLHVVGEHHPVKRIEAMLARGEWGQVPEVPLPNAGGGVATFLQDLSQGDLVGVQPSRGRWEEDAGESHAHRVAAGHECRAGRAADGGRCVVVGEPGALGGEPVDVRCLDLLEARALVRGPIAPDVVVAEVIGEDDDDVRLLRGRVCSVEHSQRS